MARSCKTLGIRMWFHEIPLTRHIGITRCTCVRIDDSKPWHVLTRLGFLPVRHHLVEVPAAKRMQSSKPSYGKIWRTPRK
jgi:hypothetical protein